MQALAADEALLDRVAASGQRAERWWIASTPAVVVGLGLHYRLSAIVDIDRCRAADTAVLTRRAGGGALLLDSSVICGAICVPTHAIPSDVTESYRWLGDELADALRNDGYSVRRLDVQEARDDIAKLRASSDPADEALLTTCYGALSPHEVVADTGKKVVGLAQIRRREAALFQIGILRQDQSRLADYLRLPTEALRERLRVALAQRTVGLCQLPSGGVLESFGNCRHAQSVP